MESKNLRGIKLGEGRAKICVPVTGVTARHVIDDVHKISQMFKDQVDLVELRADFFEDLKDEEKLVALLTEVRKVLGDMPVLFTVRTKDEGGNIDLSDEVTYKAGEIENDYYRIVTTAIKSGMVDAIDWQIMKAPVLNRNLIEEAHKAGILAIGSYHNFEKTPEKIQMIKILLDMEREGMDVAKIAVMPNSSEDVINLLTASDDVSKIINIPIITISMGKLGAVSRIAGHLTSSSVTFGVADDESAPGQLEVVKLKELLEILN